MDKVGYDLRNDIINKYGIELLIMTDIRCYVLLGVRKQISNHLSIKLSDF